MYQVLIRITGSRIKNQLHVNTIRRRWRDVTRKRESWR